ncbi:hypothetical protein RAA17_01225 [Komagataeibacter rhaeticus]|nr:hypothetical protein [Komagataeibacter rhaeticus]
MRGETRRLLEMLCILHGSIHRGSRDAGALVRCVVQAQPDLGLPDKDLPASPAMMARIRPPPRNGSGLATRWRKYASSTQVTGVMWIRGWRN